MMQMPILFPSLLAFLFFALPILGSPIPEELIGEIGDDFTIESKSLDRRSLTNSLLNSSSGLDAFLGDHNTVIFQNSLVKNQSSCADMTVLFARGTGEAGKFEIGPKVYLIVSLRS